MAACHAHIVRVVQQDSLRLHLVRDLHEPCSLLLLGLASKMRLTAINRAQLAAQRASASTACMVLITPDNLELRDDPPSSEKVLT